MDRLRPLRSAALRALALVPAAVLLSAAVGSRAGAQERERTVDTRCDLLQNRYVRSILQENGSRVNYIAGPALLRCADGLEVRADSIVEFTGTQFRQLMGRVVMDGPEIYLEGDRVHHRAQDGRIDAWTDVVVVQKADSMRLEGDSLRILQADDVRDRDLLAIWGGEPRAVLRFRGREGEGAGDLDREPAPDSAAADSTAAESIRADSVPTQAPDTVYADRIHLEGQRRFAASGSVRIASAGVEALSDSADYQRRDGILQLLTLSDDGRARVLDEAYEMSARRVEIAVVEGEIREAEAREDARVTSEDLRLTAPVVRIFLVAGEIDHLVAVRRAEEDGDGRAAPERTARRPAAAPTADGSTDPGAPRDIPEAVTEDFHLRGDSIDVRAPAQRLERVFAAGTARGEALGRDTLNTPGTPEIMRRDWIEGDSIVATFVRSDSAAASPRAARAGAPSDSLRSRYRLDQLVAGGSARSLYRLLPRDSADTGPAARDSTRADSADTGPPAPGAGPDSTAAADSLAVPTRRLAVHYVTGDVITIVLDDGAVDEMRVEGQTEGLYLQPRELRRAPGLAPDTTGAQASPDGASGPPPPRRDRP